MPAVSDTALLSGISTFEPDLFQAQDFSIDIRPDTNAFPSLLEMVNRLLDAPDEQPLLSHTLETIANHEGEFGLMYRPDLFRALLHFQSESGAQLSTKVESRRVIEHLGIVEELLVPYGINEMQMVERAEWAKLLNRHLAYLSFVPEWNDLQTTHLTRVASILEKILFDAKDEFRFQSLGDSDLIRNTSRLISDRLPHLLKDLENEVNLHCVVHLLGLASEFKSPQLREVLEDAFWQVNARCSHYAPESYGTGMADDSADLDDEFDQEEDDEDSSVAVADKDDSEALAGGYEILAEEDLTFDERQQEREDSLMQDLEGAHDTLLAALLDTPDADPYSTFWTDVLTRNSFNLNGWKVALHGLEKVHVSVIEDFVTELVEAGVGNSLAVAHLLDVMAFTEQSVCVAPLDQVVIDAVKQLSRREQREIIKHARSVIQDVCELLELADDAPAMLEKLEAALRSR